MIEFPPRFLLGTTGADEVATLVSELDQHTVVPVQFVPPVSVRALPLLSVPAAVSDVVNPTLTLGFGGSIVIVETVGLRKSRCSL